jgi:hypothetical protein
VTALGLVALDVLGRADARAHAYGLLFELLVTGAVAPGVVSVMAQASGASREQRLLAMLGALLWFAGVGTPMVAPALRGGPLLGADAAACVAGAALGLAGARGLRPARTRAERRRGPA